MENSLCPFTKDKKKYIKRYSIFSPKDPYFNSANLFYNENIGGFNVVLGHIWKFWTFGIFKEPEGGFPKTNSNSFLATNIMKPRYKLTVKKNMLQLVILVWGVVGVMGFKPKLIPWFFPKLGVSVLNHYKFITETQSTPT